MKLNFTNIAIGFILSAFLISCSGSKKTKCNTCPKWGSTSKKAVSV